jgi:hypothetical protein
VNMCTLCCTPGFVGGGVGRYACMDNVRQAQMFSARAGPCPFKRTGNQQEKRTYRQFVTCLKDT